MKDDLYFTGSVKDGVQVHSREHIEKKLQALREKETAKALFEARVQRIRSGNLLPEDLPFMSEIEQVANGINASSRLMKEAGVEATPEKAQQLLIRLKVWTYRNNPYPARAGIEFNDPEFPEPTSNPFSAQDRTDLTWMDAYAIDDESSGDPDDAVSFDNGLIWVHIADPAAIVPSGSEIDLEARNRGENLYLPEGIAHMLPAWMTDRCGLGLHETSPALSFAVRIDPETGNAELEKMVLSTVKVQRCTYQSAAELADRKDMTEMRRLLEKFRKKRAEDGALFIELPEVKILVQDDLHVLIRPLPLTPEREFVANAMLAAGSAVAKWAAKHEIPMPFVVQDPPETEERGDSLVQMFALRKACQPSKTQTFPGKHAGLGLEPYVRVTSPLRRYCDLLAHQQIHRFLTGQELIRSDEMENILSVSEQAAYIRRKTERISNEYWTLVYLTQQPADFQIDAVPVFKQDDRWTFLLPSLAYEYKTRSGGKILLGEPLRFQLQSADPVTLSLRMKIVASASSHEKNQESQESLPESDVAANEVT